LETEELKYAFLACLASGIENPDSGMGKCFLTALPHQTNNSPI
jgi:hypothetical protein